jgi:hypothetical protein
VAPIAIAFGVLLTILGLVLYGMSEIDPKPTTALIPSALGVLLIVLGLVARGAGEKVRMHTMHGAAVIGLIGLIGGIVRIAIAVPRLGTEHPPSNLAIGGNAAMALLSGLFLALCIKSFVDARRARKQRATPGEPGA